MTHWQLLLLLLIVLFLLHYKRIESFASEFLDKDRLTENDRIIQAKKEYWRVYKQLREAKEKGDHVAYDHLERTAIVKPTRLKPINKDYPFQ